MRTIKELQWLIERSMFSSRAWTQREIEYREHLRSEIAWKNQERK